MGPWDFVIILTSRTCRTPDLFFGQTSQILSADKCYLNDRTLIEHAMIYNPAERLMLK